MITIARLFINYVVVTHNYGTHAKLAWSMLLVLIFLWPNQLREILNTKVSVYFASWTLDCDSNTDFDRGSDTCLSRFLDQKPIKWTRETLDTSFRHLWLSFSFLCLVFNAFLKPWLQKYGIYLDFDWSSDWLRLKYFLRNHKL